MPPAVPSWDGRINLGGMGIVANRDRAAVFIDNGYFAKVLKNEFGQAKIDFLRFSEALCRGSERFRTYFYYCMPHQSEHPSKEESARTSSANKFYSSLKKHPRFEIRLGRLSKVSYDPPVFEQKGVDVLMSVDLVRLSWSQTIDKAILVTGDSDFVPAVQAAKEAGTIVELVYSARQHVSEELFNASDERREITSALIEDVTLRAPSIGH
jgi:uncharacterized LabA/DUF88 family protein